MFLRLPIDFRGDPQADEDRWVSPGAVPVGPQKTPKTLYGRQALHIL